MPQSIAIDGPVGAGKTTAAKKLAEALGIRYLDTGAMYRAVALQAIRQNISLTDADALRRMLQNTTVSIRFEENSQRTMLDGEDVSELIRSPEVGNAGSVVSAYPFVRKKMVALQREIAGQADMVLDGRDIGTNVLPNAAFKFFLTATPEVRARRRHDELAERGVSCDYQKIYDELMERDERDMNRAVDPLTRAEDAITIDATELDLPGVLKKMVTIIKGGR